MQRRTIVARVTLRQRRKARSEFAIVAAFGLISSCRTTETLQPARAALADAAALEVIHGPAPLRGRHHFPSTNCQTVLLKVLIDLYKQLIAQVVGLQQMPKLAYPGEGSLSHSASLRLA